MYVLGLEDPAGGLVPPYYKLGITTGTVAKRIRQLQNGALAKLRKMLDQLEASPQ